MTDENKLGGFDFAIQQLKQGRKVARVGWNGKGMWISLGAGRRIAASDFWNNNVRQFAFTQEDQKAEVLPYIVMKTADNKILMGWLASQSDMLAEDWMIVA